MREAKEAASSVSVGEGELEKRWEREAVDRRLLYTTIVVLRERKELESSSDRIGEKHISGGRRRRARSE